MEEQQVVQRPSMIQRMERMRRNRGRLEINTSRDLTRIKQQLVNLKEAADLVIAEIDELSQAEETTNK
jgi:hypothetical protein